MRLTKETIRMQRDAALDGYMRVLAVRDEILRRTEAAEQLCEDEKLHAYLSETAAEDAKMWARRMYHKWKASEVWAEEMQAASIDFQIRAEDAERNLAALKELHDYNDAEDAEKRCEALVEHHIEHHAYDTFRKPEHEAYCLEVPVETDKYKILEMQREWLDKAYKGLIRATDESAADVRKRFNELLVEIGEGKKRAEDAEKRIEGLREACEFLLDVCRGIPHGNFLLSHEKSDLSMAVRKARAALETDDDD